VSDFISQYVDLVSTMIPGYMNEGKKYLTIAIGCTGGKHRSVAVTAEISKGLNSKGNLISAYPTHRDVGRE
jgi:UPF0042 nucleotide-binding protein